MFGFGGLSEVLFILFLAMLIFGPEKLPEIGRMLAKGMAEVRKASNELKRTLNAELAISEQEAEARRNPQPPQRFEAPQSALVPPPPAAWSGDDPAPEAAAAPAAPAGLAAQTVPADPPGQAAPAPETPETPERAETAETAAAAPVPTETAATAETAAPTVPDPSPTAPVAAPAGDADIPVPALPEAYGEGAGPQPS
jgi:TatA/E family protein of Tat protein translocase